MKRNVAGQKIGAQMTTAADGSNFTGAVTVYVTGDAGTQAVGSVGSGACVHEGKGYHTYAPAQAETDYDLVAFTFEGTGAVTVTVQVFTSFPQTGDAFARLGAPAGASASADIAAVKAETASIQADTNDIQARLPAALVSGRIDASVGAMAADVMTAAAAAADLTTELQAGLATAAAVATVQADTDNIQTRLPAALTGAGNMKSDALALDGSTTAATNLKQQATVIYVGTVTGAATTTSLIDSGLTQAATNFWKGRFLIVLTGTSKYEMTDITGFNAATDQLTFTAMTAALTGGDTYVIVTA